MWPIIFLFNLAIHHSTETLHQSIDDLAEETQHAVCTIMTEQIQTTANATITRQLKGVCTTKQLEWKFQQLELKLLTELHKIKLLLGSNEALDSHLHLQQQQQQNDQDPDVEITFKDNEKHHQEPSPNNPGGIVNRFLEIIHFNNTVQILNNQKIFTYFWKIGNIDEVLTRRNVVLETQSIEMLDLDLKMQLYPHHLNSDYIGLQLKTNNGNFEKRYKFSILEQMSFGKDITSPLLGRLGELLEPYRVPNGKLLERNYLWNNEMFVKLIVYLEL